MNGLSKYQVQHSYASALWPEPLAEGDIVEMSPEQAAMLERDSPGVLLAVSGNRQVRKTRKTRKKNPPKEEPIKGDTFKAVKDN